jgi:hypothetical protein
VPDSDTGMPTKPPVFAIEMSSLPESFSSAAMSTFPPATSFGDRTHRSLIVTCGARSCSEPLNSSNGVAPSVEVLVTPTLERSTPW